MKVETTAPQQGFTPRSIIITFETQKELDAFGSLFNVGSVATTMRGLGIDSSDIYDKIQYIGGDIHTYVGNIYTKIRSV